MGHLWNTWNFHWNTRAKKLENFFDDNFTEVFNEHMMKHMATVNEHDVQEGLARGFFVRANAQDAGVDDAMTAGASSSSQSQTTTDITTQQ